jgi:uncharacterized protein (DUF433 family)
VTAVVTKDRAVNYGAASIKGIRTRVLLTRFCAGESIADLVADYPRLTAADVEEGVRYGATEQAEDLASDLLSCSTPSTSDHENACDVLGEMGSPIITEHAKTCGLCRHQLRSRRQT